MKVVITGPRSVGKSTVSPLVAELLGVPCLSSDDLLDRRLAAEGGLVLVNQSGPTDAHIAEGIAMVTHTMEQAGPFVFDLAGGSISDPRTCTPVLQSLRGAKVIGLLPCESDRDAVEALFRRERRRDHFSALSDVDLLEKVRRDYQRLRPVLVGRADLLLLTGDRPAQVLAAIIVERLCGLQS